MNEKFALVCDWDDVCPSFSNGHLGRLSTYAISHCHNTPSKIQFCFPSRFVNWTSFWQFSNAVCDRRDLIVYKLGFFHAHTVPVVGHRPITSIGINIILGLHTGLLGKVVRYVNRLEYWLSKYSGNSLVRYPICVAKVFGNKLLGTRSA